MDSDIQANLRGRWGASALFLFDIAITIDQEISLVWNSPWSIPKVLYLSARYIGLGTSVLTAVVSSSDNVNKFCRIFNPIQYLFIIITLTVPDGLLLLRVLALFPGRKWVHRFLLATYGCLVTLQVVLIIVEFRLSVMNSVPPEENNFGCLGASGLSDNAYSISSVAVLLFNSLLFIITLVVLIPRWPRGTDLNFAPLVTLLIRDGSVYFALMFAIYAILTIMPLTLTNRPGIELVALPWSIVIGPIASCRLFINLRGSREQPATGSTWRIGTNDQPHPNAMAVDHDADIDLDPDDEVKRDAFEMRALRSGPR